MTDKNSSASAPDDLHTRDGILNYLREAGKDSLIQRMGIELLEASAEKLVGTMPVAGNTQPYGLLHGGASVVLAETLRSEEHTSELQSRGHLVCRLLLNT